MEPFSICTTKQNKIARGIFQCFDFINNKVQKITKLIIVLQIIRIKQSKYRRLTLDELRRRLRRTVLTWLFESKIELGAA